MACRGPQGGIPAPTLSRRFQVRGANGLQIYIRDGWVRLYTMNAADWSDRYPLIVEESASTALHVALYPPAVPQNDERMCSLRVALTIFPVFSLHNAASLTFISKSDVAALLVATVVDVIAAGAKMGAARNYLYAAPMTGISVALPSSMKSFPVKLPQ